MKIGRHADDLGVFIVICKKTLQQKYRPPNFEKGGQYQALIIERDITLIEVLEKDLHPVRFTESEFRRFFEELVLCPKERRLLRSITLAN